MKRFWGKMGGYCVVWLAITLPTNALAVSGHVFRDGNGNGQKDTGELGIPGVTVKAFTNGTPETLAGTATSGVDGSYNLTGASGAVRVEFEIPAAGCNADRAVDFAAPNAQHYGSSVQFVDAAATNVNFGVLNAAEYVVSSNPTMFTSFMYAGNGNAGTISGNAPALFSYAYSNSGRAASLYSVARWPGDTPDPGTAPDPSVLLKQSQIGTVWGGAYSKQAKKLFLSAFLRRHASLGPDGSGAVYMLDPASPPTGTPSFFNLDALGFPTQGSGAYVGTQPGFHPVIGTDNDRDLQDGSSTPSRDKSAFGQVGKVSLGDLELSDDGRYLFVTNLYDRKLYRIDLQNAQSPVAPSAAQVTAYNNAPWLTLSCASGVARPFGLKYYRGKIYTGVVCTGENGAAAANSTRAYVYAIDPASNGSGATIAIEFPLNYDKQTDDQDSKGWFNWTDNFNEPTSLHAGQLSVNPQPMLSDIEFDSDGSMILAFADRLGFQLGYNNYSPTTGTDLYSAVVGGDILRVYKDPTTCSYQLEANGQAGNLISASRTAAQDVADYGEFLHPGPGAANGTGSAFTGYTDIDTSYTNENNKRREFYFGDYAELRGERYPRESHVEGIFGALALWPSSGEVIATGMDPAPDHPGSGGTYKLSNTTGARNSGYNLYDDYDPATYLLRDTDSVALGTTMAKAAGLGDIEITGDVPSIEVGNRVWLDTDKDGIQDGDESGIPDVPVQLLSGTTVLASATTAADGTYYFSSAVGTDTASNKYGITQLQPNTAFTIKFPVTFAVSGTTYNLTTATVGSNTLIDSNAPASGEVAIAATDIPVAGANNHSFDVGYAPPATHSIGNRVWFDTNNNGLADVGESAVPANVKLDLKDTGGTVLQSTQTDANGRYLFHSLAAGSYQVCLTADNFTTGGLLGKHRSSTGFTDANTTNVDGDDSGDDDASDGVCSTLVVLDATEPTGETTATGDDGNDGQGTPDVNSNLTVDFGVVPPTDLKLTKMVDKASAHRGDTLIYTLTLSNETGVAATGVKVADNLPSGVTLVEATPSQGTFASNEWDVGTVAANATVTLTLEVKVN